MEPESIMNEAELLTHALAMPLTSPAFPRGPYRFFDREYLIITYRTDPIFCAGWCRNRWRSTATIR